MKYLTQKNIVIGAAIWLAAALACNHMSPVVLSSVPAAASSAPAGTGYKTVTFAFLASYPVSNDKQYVYSLERRKERKWPDLYFKIPPGITALNGSNVEITGYMMPIEDPIKGQLHKFVLFRNPITCCFGCANMLNEYMTVTLNGGGMVNYTPDMPVSVRGRLSVGAIFEQGYLMSIYQLTADSVSQTPGAAWK